MTRFRPWPVLALVCLVAACGSQDGPKDAPPPSADMPVDQMDAETLGREVLELVDRAVDYRGSHRGRPATSLRQLGVDSLTPATARHLINVHREPVITVQFRRLDGHQITSCRGDSNILEEASINAGRFTLMCTARSGAQRPVQVGGAGR
ncbi:MAG: hypothetical protein ACREM9_15165 [Gemmatimonadales bacterium]